MTLKIFIKKSIRAVTPYGALVIYRKIKARFTGKDYSKKKINIEVKAGNPVVKNTIENDLTRIYYYKQSEPRLSIDKMCEALELYDVISFDIFDTALYRKVENPKDVFAIMASEMEYNDFISVRQKAERDARRLKESTSFTREIVLSDIYEILEKYYAIDRYWMNREIEIELDLAQKNPYILEVYLRTLSAGKEIIFTSDMYLPKNVIIEMLKKNGYISYSRIYLSNETKLRKGDGTLQKLLLEDYKGKKIVHIGDNKESDVNKSIHVGLDAIYNPESRALFRENDMDNLSGSFYRSVINTQISNETLYKNLYYEHGFRIGGILTAGFCEYINAIAEQKKIDKILFCARDCDVVWKVYNQFYKKFENDYMQISSYAILNVTCERHLSDLISRFIFRYFQRYKNEKTIETIFSEIDLDYLTEYLDDYGINKFLPPVAINMEQMEKFILNHKEYIVRHNVIMVNAAKKYFSALLKNVKNILVVDIGWSSTCITAFKYFVETHFNEKDYKVSGALMCSSRNPALKSSIEGGNISAYVYSPFNNMDLTRLLSNRDNNLYMSLKFLFNSCEAMLAGYVEMEDGNIGFQRSMYNPNNVGEIQKIQSGLIDFVKIYRENTAPYKKLFTVSPYTAFNPLREAITRQEYIKAVNKNYTYDTIAALFKPVVSQNY